MAHIPEQTLANHAKFTPIYHFALAPLVVGVVGWSIYRLVSTPNADTAMGCLVAVVLLLLTAIARTFPLKVQDRVIRLEEQLRMYRVLPPEMHTRIGEFTPNQLIAMRFASDAELPELARKVHTDRLTDRKAVKQQIRNWRADHFRV